MADFILSASGFTFLLGFFAVGAVGALFLRKKDKFANLWSNCFAIAGSLSGLIFSSFSLALARQFSFSAVIPAFPLLSVTFSVDKLSAFFIFVISLIALFCSIYGIGYVKHFYKKYSIGTLGFFYNLFIAGMLMVVSAGNGLFFLIAWEIMSVASYFLVVYDRKDENNIKAGFLYLIMTHIGTACIIFSFLLLYKFTGSFDFGAIKTGSGAIPLFVKDIIFILAVIGFGTKAGIIPFHIWLPGAHPAAPSHVSALMSGVMIKTGIYMMIRIFFDMLQPIPAWWGLALLAIGAVSSLLGVLYALTEHDLKRLLAYHSIENIGIILLGLGSALAFSSFKMPALALLGLIAALFHTLNHATFKSLLFLSAGSVINQTHTRNMEEYGGIIKFMPQTALFFLVGSMAISALPPFNGFFSEWLTFQALFQGISSFDSYAKWMFMGAAGALAFTGGLALACFVKAFGSIFLARPRSEEVRHAKESAPSLLIGMGALALLSLLFGIFSGYLSQVFELIGRDFSVLSGAPVLFSGSSGERLAVNNFSSVSASAIFLMLIAAVVVVWVAVKYFVYKKQIVKIGSTWDCGTDLTPRMEITSTGFARSIILIFKGILRPSIQHAVEYHDAESRYLPKARTVTLGISDIYRLRIYDPINKLVIRFSLGAKNVQSGIINVYILYIFIALLAVLFFAI